MKELIKIQENESLGQAVSARELYQFLELDQKNYSHWIKRNITNNAFATEGEDYTPYQMVHPQTTNTDYSPLTANSSKIKSSLKTTLDNVHSSLKTSKKRGNFATDFAITPTFAKKLSMQAPGEKGEMARDYFIQCERIAKSIQNGMGIQIRNGQATISTRSISGTTGILHDELIRLIKTYLHEHTEVLNEKRYPRKGHLRKGKFLIENIWELYIHNNKGVPQKEYILTRDGFNYLVKWHGFLAFSGFLPHYSREFEILAHQEHIKALE